MRKAFMLLQTHRGNQGYRFSTRTLSEVPLLIGEILRRGDLRLQKRAKREARIRKIREILGML
jgi:hypothetical protein